MQQHCHIAWHADEGLAVQFLESPERIGQVESFPADFDNECHAWSAYSNRAAYAKHDSGI